MGIHAQAKLADNAIFPGLFHPADILLGIQAGLRPIGLGGDSDLGEPFARHKPVEETGHVSAVQGHLCFFYLISQHNRLVCKHIQHGVKF